MKMPKQRRIGKSSNPFVSGAAQRTRTADLLITNPIVPVVKQTSLKNLKLRLQTSPKYEVLKYPSHVTPLGSTTVKANNVKVETRTDEWFYEKLD